MNNIICIALVLLTIYYIVQLVKEIFLYMMSLYTMKWVEYLFQVTSYEIGENDNMTLHFSVVENVKDKELLPILSLFRDFTDKGIIVTARRGIEYVPCFNRDLLLKYMDERILISSYLISTYCEWDFFTKLLLKKKYSELCERHEIFSDEYDRISKVSEGEYFCMVNEL